MNRAFRWSLVSQLGDIYLSGHHQQHRRSQPGLLHQSLRHCPVGDGVPWRTAQSMAEHCYADRTRWCCVSTDQLRIRPLNRPFTGIQLRTLWSGPQESECARDCVDSVLRLSF